MKIEYKKTVKIDELAHLIPFKAGATFSQLWQIFYYTRLFKYVSYRQYSQIKKSYNKICTYKKLQELCDLGYFKNPSHEVYCATNKVLPVLKEAGFIVDTLPPEPVGKGDINELNNTNVFIQALKEHNSLKKKHFYTLLFPNFGYLIPDALMVLKNEKKYKLIFLEAEAKKPEWNSWIDKKRDNYLKLSRDILFYEYWISICKILEFPIPKIENLKFSVTFYCNIVKDYGRGFKFIKSK